MKSILTPKWVSFFGFLLILVGLSFKDTYEMTAMIGSLLLAMWVAIAMHELGHVIFGYLSGFEFVFFAFGPVQIEKTIDGIKMKENKHWLFFGGVAMMLPPQMKKESLTKKWAIFVVGGPVMSLLLESIFYILYGNFSDAFLLNCAIMNGGILLATIIPFKTSMKTDGYILFSMLRNNEESILLVEELLIMKELLGRKQPVEWNQTYIKLAKQKDVSIDNLQYAMMIYYFEIEQNGFKSAVEAMKEYREIPVTAKNKFSVGFLIHMQQLSHFLMDDVPVEKMVYFQRLLSSLEPVSYFRGKAIIAYLENDKDSALENLKKVKKIIEENEALYGFFKAEKRLTELVEKKYLFNIDKLLSMVEEG
ncbi:M50 family metallopeptidase [Psychrobacillus sp. FSL H8-0483]|uniref:M50 family metallopeptidase n=1 Tax=Psychrobacillus sp. FSL H8-0483 TaxID=2921389 RepID=UPI00315A024B